MRDINLYDVVEIPYERSVPTSGFGDFLIPDDYWNVDCHGKDNSRKLYQKLDGRNSELGMYVRS